MTLPQRTFPGELADGLSADLLDVDIALDIDAVRAVDRTGRTRALWPFKGLKVMLLDGGVAHLTHLSAPGALLSSSDAALPSALAATIDDAPALAALNAPRRRLLHIAAYGFAVALVLAGFYAALPGIAHSIARRTPFWVEEKLAGQLVPLLTKNRCASPDATAALDRLVTRLGGVSADGARIQAWLLDSEMVNAFTLPGGTVLLTRGLVKEAKGPDELAGVLAHELAHVAERHVMAQVVRASLMSFVAAVAIGDFSGVLIVDPAVAHQLISRRFDRSYERAADRAAIAQLDRAGISREGFAAFFERIAKTTDVVPAILSTHPHSAERVNEVRRGAPNAARTPAMSEEDWTILREACSDPNPKL